MQELLFKVIDDQVKQSYLRYRHKRAILLGVGVALVVSGLGVANLFMLLPVMPTQDSSVLADVLDKIIRIESHEFVDFSFSDKHVLAPFSFVAMIVIGVVVLSDAKSDFDEFSDAYGFVSCSYTPEERENAQRSMRKPLGLGIAFSVVGFVLVIISMFDGANHLLFGIGEILVAIGAGLIVYMVNGLKGFDLIVYNYRALRTRSVYSLEQEQNFMDIETLLSIKRIQLRARTINQALLTIGALGSLMLYFLPTLYTPLYWVPLAIAFILCFSVTHYHIRKVRPLIQNYVHSEH